MLRRVQQTILDHSLLKPGRRVIAAVSGGADSTAMLYALWFLKDRLKFQLAAAHLDHGLRGRQSRADAHAVQLLCVRLGVPLLVGKIDHPASLRSSGMSLEMAARDARHAFLLRAKNQMKGDVVALAHNRDDQAETVLMRLLSGTGLEGLGGIHYSSEPCEGLQVVRPMLDVSRAMIEQFLRRHGIPWRTDATNRDTVHLRNRVRHDVMPYLKSHGFPAAVPSLVRLADIVREEGESIARETSRLLNRCLATRSPRGSLRVDALRRLSVAQCRRVLRGWLKANGVADRGIDYSAVERLRRMIQNKASRSFQFRDDILVRCTGMRLSVSAPVEKRSHEIERTVLNVPGRTRLEAAGLEVSVTSSRGYSREASRIGAFPATCFIARLPGASPELILRTREPGDVISPTGMEGSVAIKDLLINAKVPKEARSSIPVLESGGSIVWVAGYRVSRRFAVATRNGPSWKIRIERKSL